MAHSRKPPRRSLQYFYTALLCLNDSRGHQLSKWYRNELYLSKEWIFYGLNMFVNIGLYRNSNVTKTPFLILSSEKLLESWGNRLSRKNILRASKLSVIILRNGGDNLIFDVHVRVLNIFYKAYLLTYNHTNIYYYYEMIASLASKF